MKKSLLTAIALILAAGCGEHSPLLPNGEGMKSSINSADGPPLEGCIFSIRASIVSTPPRPTDLHYPYYGSICTGGQLFVSQYTWWKRDSPGQAWHLWGPNPHACCYNPDGTWGTTYDVYCEMVVGGTTYTSAVYTLGCDLGESK
jgi:hypothetical protein